MDRNEINLVRCLKCQKILKCSRYDTAALLQHIRTDHPEVEIIDSDSKVEKRKTNKSEEMHNRRKSPKSPHFTEDKDPEAIPISGKVLQNPNEVGSTDYTFEKNQNEDFNPRQTNGPYYVPEEDLTHLSIKSELLEKYPEIKQCEFCPRDPNAKVIYTRRYKIRTPSTTSALSSATPRTPRKRHLYRISIEKWRPTNGTIYCPKCGCNKSPLIEARTERFTENEWCACCLLNCWPLCFFPWIFPGHEVEHLHCSQCKAFLGLYNRHTNCLNPNRDFMANGRQMNIKFNHLPPSQIEPKRLPSKNKPVNTENDSPKTNANRLPSIVIDGKELHPDMVARLQLFKKFGHLAGIDLEAVSNDTHKGNQTDYIDSFRGGVPSHAPPSVDNK